MFTQCLFHNLLYFLFKNLFFGLFTFLSFFFYNNIFAWTRTLSHFNMITSTRANHRLATSFRTFPADRTQQRQSSNNIFITVKSGWTGFAFRSSHQRVVTTTWTSSRLFSSFRAKITGRACDAVFDETSWWAVVPSAACTGRLG